MKICLAQAKSIKGNVTENISNHLRLINQSIKRNADLIVFPELSLTAYEPELAEVLAVSVTSATFDVFQKKADENNISIGVGIPTKATNGINISMLIFQPHQRRLVYSKSILHADELPYFVSGEHQPMLNIKGTKIAFGICYETLQRAHFIAAQQKGADVYIASVAKPDRGTDKAYLHFPSIAKEFQTPILMSNCVGFCDNFLSNGQTAVWNNTGALLGTLDNESEGLLLCDMNTEEIEIWQLKVETGKLEELEAIFQIYLNARRALAQENIHQWTDNYPSMATVERDLKQNNLYVLKNANEIIGAININEHQASEYQSVDWQFDASKVLVIHRLVVNPKYQGKGYARVLMDFTESFALTNNYSTIRLDTYSQNDRAIQFYIKQGYIIRGDVSFPNRDHTFHCMEKELIKR